MAINARIKRILFSKVLRWTLGILGFIVLSSFLSYRYWLVPKINQQIGAVYYTETGHHLSYAPLEISLRGCHLGLADIKDEKQLFAVERLFIDIDCRKSFKNLDLVIRTVQLDGLTLNLKQSKSGWNFDDILAVQKEIPKDDKPSTLNVSVEAIQIAKFSADFHVQALPQQLHVELPRIAIAKLQSDLSLPLSVDTRGELNHQAKIDLNLNVDLKTLDGKIDTRLEQVPFKWFESHIKEHVLADVQSGELNVSAKLNLTKGELTFVESQGSLNQVILRPTSLDQDAVKWTSLEWQDAHIDLKNQSINIPQMALLGLDGQFIIDKQRKTNLQALLKPDSPQGKAVQNTDQEKPWQFSLAKLRINNAAIGFFDQSLVPSFSVIVQQFSGDILNISTDPTVETQVDLKGNVDGYSPVTLVAKAKPFAAAPKMNAVFKMNDLDMGALSPYSAEYAGWKIKKGHLTVALDYRYDQGKILGKNHVVISHLAFGEKVRSPNALDIPLRLGLSLLTDENGIAILDTEITGDPKNPQFNFKEIIWRAVKNTFKKVITSPFRFLASLINTEKDLGSISFTFGESQLSDEAKTNLSLIKDALVKRPRLLLTVKANLALEQDTLALQEEQVKTLLRNAGATAEEQRDHNGKWVELVVALATKKQIVLEKGQPAETTYKQLIASETVTEERLLRLQHERAQAIKQYFVITLAVPSERVLIDGQHGCNQDSPCKNANAEFTLDDE